MKHIKSKSLVPIFYGTLFTNFVLFIFKLYIGISANSISIYSDGINNLFDGFSATAALLCFYLLNRSKDCFSQFFAKKTEQLLSLVLSVTVFAVGLVFLYNSAERLMYPAPVWFTVSYLAVLAATALVKLVMFFALKVKGKQLESDVLRLMSLDSLTDFFITGITVLTLFVSQKGSYSLDAFAGIGISIFIIITAVKNIKESLSELIDLPEKEKRSKIVKLLEENLSGEDYEAELSFTGEKKVYVKTKKEFDKQELCELKDKIYNETGIKLYLITDY